MAIEVPVKFYNSFWVKKIKNSQSPSRPIWPGLPWNPPGYPSFPGNAETSGADKNWFIEEARIKGGYNNTSVSFGVKAYLNEEDPVQEKRGSSLIYSGIFNSRTGVNQTNFFSLAESITKDLNPANGSIQKLFAEDSNLITFQERKTGYVLINKNTIYTGDQGAAETTNIRVLGQYVPYAGEYGISNDPESFAYFGLRKYFTDKNRGVVLRLSRDGLTEISMYGMKDFFRDSLPNVDKSYKKFTASWTLAVGQEVTEDYIDSFDIVVREGCKVIKGSTFRVLINGTFESVALISNVVETNVENTLTITLNQTVNTNFLNFENPPTQSGDLFYYYRGSMMGAYDNYNRVYTLSLQNSPDYISQNEQYQTVTFDETVLGWVSFYSYKPSFMYSINGKFYSTTGNSIYEHYASDKYMEFYGVQRQGSVDFVFNDNPSLMKNFKTISYEGDNGWKIDVMTSGNNQFNLDYPVTSPQTFNTINVDSITSILSYDEGLYLDPITGQPTRAGFSRKENKYVANLVNNSVPAAGEIIYGDNITGIKGYFAKVKLITDNTTDVGGLKEIWSLGTEVVKSS